MIIHMILIIVLDTYLYFNINYCLQMYNYLYNQMYNYLYNQMYNYFEH